MCQRLTFTLWRLLALNDVQLVFRGIAGIAWSQTITCEDHLASNNHMSRGERQEGCRGRDHLTFPLPQLHLIHEIGRLGIGGGRVDPHELAAVVELKRIAPAGGGAAACAAKAQGLRNQRPGGGIDFPPAMPLRL